MYQIFKSCIEVDQIEETLSLEEIKRHYNNIQRCNLYTDMIFAEVNDEAVSYGRCMWNLEVNGEYFYPWIVNLKPEWRGKGIGFAMAQHLHARIKEIARQHPKTAVKYLQNGASDTQLWQQDLLARLEMEPIRYGILMTRPCSQPIETTPLPEGIEMRPTKTADLRKIWESANEAFRDHFGAVEPTEEEYQNW